MTETEIANLAISLLGGKKLSNIDTDTTPQALACQKWFDAARDECLASHAWNFAIKRHRATLSWNALSGTAITDSSGLVKITDTAHGLSTGDRIHVRNVTGVSAANGTWYVTRIDDDNFTLDDSVFSGTYTDDTGEWIKAPLFGWDYQFAKPADLLRVVNLNGHEGNEDDSRPYEVEAGYILTDEDTMKLRYVYQNTTTTEWDQSFINAFAFLLASYIAQDLTGPAGKAMEMRQLFEGRIAPLARGRDARQGKGRRIQPVYDSDVVSARRGAWNWLGR